MIWDGKSSTAEPWGRACAPLVDAAGYVERSAHAIYEMALSMGASVSTPHNAAAIYAKAIEERKPGNIADNIGEVTG